MDKGGRGTNDFRSGKHNFLYSELRLEDNERTVCSLGRGDESLRIKPLEGGLGIYNFFNNYWAIPQSAPWNKVGGNDVYKELDLPKKKIGGTTNIFIGDKHNIEMDFVEE